MRKKSLSHKQAGFAHIVLLILLITGLFVVVYLVGQQTNILPKAANLPKDSITNSIIAEEKKVAGLDKNGNLTEERARFIKQTDPEGFKQLVKKGLIKNGVDKNEPTTQRTLNTPSSVQTILAPPLIDSCGEITVSGDFILNKNIATTKDQQCLNIHDTQNVNIDCQGHSIISTYNPSSPTYDPLAPVPVVIKNTQNFSLKNCSIKFHGYPNPQYSYAFRMITIEDSDQGIIQNNTIDRGWTYVTNTKNLQVLNNTIKGTYSQSKTSFSMISGNKIGLGDNNSAGYVIVASDGENNTIENNILDGGWNGDTNSWSAADDGILLIEENSDIVSGNSITNNFDCGIETAKFIRNTKITNNKITNSGLCGIGAWYYNSWLNNVIDSNTIDGSAYLFYIFYDARDPSQSAQDIYFKDNTFSNNKFSNQRSSSYIGPTQQYSSLVDFQNFRPDRAPNSTFHKENNTFKNNDFGQNLPAPILIPATMIVDQGGNQCSPINNPSQQPLSCSNANPTPSPTPSPTPFVCTACAADIKKDTRNQVNASDYAILSTCYNQPLTKTLSNGISCAVADINKDGAVNQDDYTCLKSVYFQRCQP